MTVGERRKEKEAPPLRRFQNDFTGLGKGCQQGRGRSNPQERQVEPDEFPVVLKGFWSEKAHFCTLLHVHSEVINIGEASVLFSNPQFS